MNRSTLTKIQVPSNMFEVETHSFTTSLDDMHAILTLQFKIIFVKFWYQIPSAVTVFSSSFNFIWRPILWAVHDNRLLVVLLSEVSLMFRRKIDIPSMRRFKCCIVFFHSFFCRTSTGSVYLKHCRENETKANWKHWRQKNYQKRKNGPKQYVSLFSRIEWWFMQDRHEIISERFPMRCLRHNKVHNFSLSTGVSTLLTYLKGVVQDTVESLSNINFCMRIPFENIQILSTILAGKTSDKARHAFRGCLFGGHCLVVITSSFPERIHSEWVYFPDVDQKVIK